MKQIYFLLGLSLGVAVTLFAFQNTDPVEIHFFLWQFQGPLAAVVLTAAAAGLVVALLFGLPETLTARWRIRRLERRIGDAAPEAGGPPTVGDGPEERRDA